MGEIVPVSNRTEVNAFLRQHYLGGVAGWLTAGAMVREEGLGWDGVVVVSRPTARLSPYRSEVTRLCVRRLSPKNSCSRLLGWATRWAVANRRDPVVSYADPSVGHTGAIYRAANFKAEGTTSGGDWGNRAGRKVRYAGPKLRFVWWKP
jgi:hypothetical protein